MSLSEPGSKKRERVSRKTWILAGAPILAAVVGAIITGIFTLASHPGGQVVPPTPSLSSPSHSKDSATPNMVPRWQGQIGIGNLGIDLDDLPPTVDPNTFTLAVVSGDLQVGPNARFAAWTGAANPSYAQCHEWVLTNGTQQDEGAATGMQLCVLTAAGRTALVTITGLSNDDATAEARATVWNLGS